MNRESDNKQYAKKLARYLSGEMNEVEHLAFERETAVSEEEKTMLEEMKKNWSSLEKYKEPEIPDSRKAWKKLYARLNNENLIPSQPSAAKGRLLPNLLRVAAIFLVLFAVGAAIYMNTSKRPAPEMVQINTGNGENTLIKTLGDGSVIYIAQNSLFSFPKEFESESRNVELKGEAFFDITPDPAKPFIIETDEAIIQVLGTAFNVKTKNGTGFELFVDRGKVKVTLKDNPSASQLVIAGEKISTENNKMVKSKYNNDIATAWYRQHMQFKDEPLQGIINVLNRNFNTTFAVAEKETGNRRLTVTFHNETAETMTELLCVALNLKSQTINGSVVLSDNKESERQN